MRFGSGLGLLSLLITMAIILFVFAGKEERAGVLGAIMKVKKRKNRWSSSGAERMCGTAVFRNTGPGPLARVREHEGP